MNTLQIEYIPITQLKVYENNARKHEKSDLQAIENSIAEFGMCDPIGIWSENNVIVEGHGRFYVLQKLKHETAPCIRLDHLSDEQRRAYALAHNKTAELSEWDFDKLDDELASLIGFDMNLFGFDELDEPSFDELEREDQESVEKITVKIVFANVGEWQRHENELRDLVSKFDANIVVGNG